MGAKTKTTSKTEPKGKERNSKSRGKPAAKLRRRKTSAWGAADRAYLTLIRRFPLRPIRTEAELDAAAALAKRCITLRMPP